MCAPPYSKFIKSYNVTFNGPFCIGLGDEIASEKFMAAAGIGAI